MQNPVPIVVDLDETLVKTDFFYESLLKFIKLNPLNFVRAIIWLITKGKAYLKSRIVEIITLDASLIPYNEDVIEFIKTKKQQNYPIILATATHQVFAEAVANHVKLFDQVFATDDNENLKGINKEKKLIKEFGEKGFIYVGDSQADLKVWRSAKAAVIVSPSKKLHQQVQSITQIEKTISNKREQPSINELLYSFDWFKSLLVFLPLLILGLWFDIQVWLNVFVAFISLCLASTSINTFAELFDLESIRKSQRANASVYASGQLSIINGTTIALLCLVLSTILSSMVSVHFLCLVIIYFLFSTFYFIYLQPVIPKPMAYSFIIAMQIFAGYLAIMV